MGITRDEISPEELWSPFLSRHMLIAGKEGWGPWTFVQFFMAQHVLRGGGLIFLNSYTDEEMEKSLQRAALHAGRPEAFRSASLETLPSVAELLEKNQILHVHVPLMRQENVTVSAVHAYLRRFWVEACQTGSRRVPDGPPFMLVIPNAEVLMTREWETWYTPTRKFGISVVAATQGIPTLSRHSPELAQVVVENSATKVMLHQASPQALHDAVGALETTYHSAPEPDVIRKMLKSLGMGEAIFASVDAFQPLRIPMLWQPKNNRLNGR